MAFKEDFANYGEKPLDETIIPQAIEVDEQTRIAAIFKQARKDAGEIVCQRGTLKRKITMLLNKLNRLHDAAELTPEHLESQTRIILKYIEDIHAYDKEIIAIYHRNMVFSVSKVFFNSEVDSQVEYHSSTQQIMGDLKFSVGNVTIAAGPTEPAGTDQITVAAQNPRYWDMRPPPLKVPTFTGTNVNPVDFKNFWSQFMNAVGNNKFIADSTKLCHLKSYLSGYAFQIIAHLSTIDDNYAVAKELLDKEFRDEAAVINTLLGEMLKFKSTKDYQYDDLKININTLRSLVYELRGLKMDFADKNSAGCKLLSYIIRDKLPKSFCRELVNVTGDVYPTIDMIFDKFNLIIRNLQSLNDKHYSFKSNMVDSYKTNNYSPINRNMYSNKSKETIKAPGALQNFRTELQPTLKGVRPKVQYGSGSQPIPGISPCKWCSNLHRLYKCVIYDTLDKRIRRCNELHICTNCAGSHSSDSCIANKQGLPFNCYNCSSKQHISALCTNKTRGESINNLCLSTQQISHQLLLPILEVEFAWRNKRVKASVLADYGAQNSYMDLELANMLGIDLTQHKSQHFNIRTFLGAQEREIYELAMGVFLNPQVKYTMPMFIDPNMNLNFEVRGINQAMKNIEAKGLSLANPQLKGLRDNKVNNIHCLMGVDLLQYLTEFTQIKCLNGSAFKVHNGIIPYGSIQNFLSESQVKEHFSGDAGKVSRVNTVIKRNNSELVKESIINAILRPQANYFDPYMHVEKDLDMDLGLSYMYSLESIGINSEDELSTVDELKIKEFKDAITFENGHYSVALPWYDDILNKVPSSSKVVLAVLNRVEDYLIKNNLKTKYDEVLDKQLRERIVEEINIDPTDYHKFNWICHRPVFKTEENKIVKTRIVYNCSLKIGNAPSLNQASYPGIDLLTSLTNLLLKFRSNRYVILSDIRSAFLMIKLKNESDRNLFCFFYKRNDKLVTYRFNTILFGLTSSMFCLLYVIKHHNAKYPVDLCSKVLDEHLYVDNLVYTHDDETVLKNLYYATNERLAQAGFELRDWQTNSQSLKDIITNENNGVEHHNLYDKVLGYRYFPSRDMLALNDYQLNPEASTKRQILSEISKPYDPLSIFSPVTVKGRILMRALWSTKVAWDEEVSDIHKISWQKLSEDYELLKTLEFNRCAIKSNVSKGEHTLNMFVDASKLAYGFACYATNSKESNLIFCKTKIAPVNQKSIPILELLSIFLSFKSLPVILKAYSESFKFTAINIFSDSQIALNWMLDPNVKVNQIFAKNRVAKIKEISKLLEDQYKVNVNFLYVNTKFNPSDLQTRGISFKEFKSNFERWIKGPLFLLLDVQLWPKHQLASISQAVKDSHISLQNQSIVNLAISMPRMASPIINISKYSNVDKLHRIIQYVFDFIFKCRKIKRDSNYESKLYLLKIMQLESFQPEINYIKTRDAKAPMPALVNQLNLFIDENNLLRSKGRIAKCNYFDYDMVNPILLGKKHDLTRAYIWNAHETCKHLGLSSTLNYVRRQGLWIPQGRQVVKSIISTCIICRRMNSFAFNSPKYTNLTKPQMKLIIPFQHTGMDFTSHIFIKTPNNKNIKMYILLYTCFNTRAVHLDLLPDMYTRTILQSIQRFCNSYSIPTDIYCDNYSSFVKGGKSLEQALASNDFQSFMKRGNIKVRHINVRSPHMGSIWERAVKILKWSLYKAIGKHRLTYFEMITLLSNIQQAINNRPLTYSTNEVGIIPITPSCFLKLQSNNNSLILSEALDVDFEVNPVGQNEMTASLAKQYEIYNDFKEAWYNEYLLSLREMHRDLHQFAWENKVKIGDIVLIKNPVKPRIYWSMGRIIELFPGSDGKIRSVKITRSDGQTSNQSICNLFPLEISITHDGTSNNNDKSGELQKQTPHVDVIQNKDMQTDVDGGSAIAHQRPPRAAAQKCRTFLRNIAVELQ